MIAPQVVYLVVSGAGSARVIPELVAALIQLNHPLYTLLTGNAPNVVSPYRLAEMPGHKLIDSYFNPALLPDRKPGLTLVAPATFNTINKISQGIADTLAHSLVAEAIGAGWPVVVAPAVNAALANHPQFGRSMDTLQQWGVTVLPLQGEGDTLGMAPVTEIIKTVQNVWETSREI